MSDGHKQTDDSQPLRERALAHLRRHELFAFLSDRGDGKATSEQELADALGMGIRLVEYHLKVLHDADLIAKVADEQATGQDTPRYVAAAML